MSNETETVPGVNEVMELVVDIRYCTMTQYEAIHAVVTKLHAAAVHAPKLAAAAKDWTRGHNARGGDGPCECSVCEAVAAYEQAMEEVRE